MIMRINRQTVLRRGEHRAGATLSNVQNAFSKRYRPETPARYVGASAAATNNRRDTVIGMTFALLLSVALVYLLMVALYNSYARRSSLCSRTGAVVGALGSLALTHQTLNLSRSSVRAVDRPRHEERYPVGRLRQHARRDGLDRTAAIAKRRANDSARS